jgi:hypothetical protein
MRKLSLRQRREGRRFQTKTTLSLATGLPGVVTGPYATVSQARRKNHILRGIPGKPTASNDLPWGKKLDGEDVDRSIVALHIHIRDQPHCTSLCREYAPCKKWMVRVFRQNQGEGRTVTDVMK